METMRETILRADRERMAMLIKAARVSARKYPKPVPATKE